MRAATAIFLLGCASVLGCATSLLRRPAPPPNLRPGWRAIPLGKRGAANCLPYTAQAGDTCASIAYQPGAVAADGTAAGPLFIRHANGDLCRASADPAVGESMTICRFAVQGMIGSFPPCNKAKPPKALSPPPLSGPAALSPCYNQLVVYGVHDAAGGGTYTDDVGALTQIGAQLGAWKKEVPGRQILLVVDNVAANSTAAFSAAAFSSLMKLAANYNADGFCFGSFLSHTGYKGAGAVLAGLVNQIKAAAPWAFISFVSAQDTKDFGVAFSAVKPITAVDTVGWTPGEGEDSRMQSYPAGGSSDGSAARFAGNTWDHASYYTYAWSWCFLGGGGGIGLGTWGACKPGCGAGSDNMYGVFFDSVETEYFGYSGTDEGNQPACGPTATAGGVATHGPTGARPLWMPPPNITAGWVCGDIGPITSAPATGACRGHCCGTDFALSKFGVKAATCKIPQ